MKHKLIPFIAATLLLTSCGTNSDNTTIVTDNAGNTQVLSTDEPTSLFPSFYTTKGFDTTKYPDVRGIRDGGVVHADNESVIIVECYQVNDLDSALYSITGEIQDDDVYRITRYSLLDYNFGEQTASFDVRAAGLQSDLVAGELTIDSHVNNIFYMNGKVCLYTNTYDYNEGVGGNKIYTVDLDSGELEESDFSFRMIPDNYIMSFQATDDKIYITTNNWSTNTPHIYVYNSEFEQEENFVIGTSNLLPQFLHSCNVFDDNHIAISYSTYDGVTHNAIYNRDTSEFTEYDYPRGIISDDVIGTNSYLCLPGGIMKLDLTNGHLETLVDYSRTDIDYSRIYSSVHVGSANDERILLITNTSGNEDQHYDITVLDATDTNPHAGMTELTAAVIGNESGTSGASYTVLKAISDFNNSHNDYYITIDNSYDIYNNVDISSHDEIAGIRSADEIINRLLVEIPAGDGPDIIISGASISPLNEPDIMLDLNSYLDPEDLNEVFEFAAPSNEPIYQMPISACPSAIVANSSINNYAENHGITFDQYTAFIDNENNGLDHLVYEYSKSELLLLLYNYCGQPDINSEDFREIAEYCNNLPDVVNQENWIQRESSEMFYVEYMSFTDMINSERVIALPSANACPPCMRVLDSVGITTSCEAPEVACDLARILISDEAQQDFEYRSVRRDILSENISNAMESHNIEAQDFFDPFDPNYRMLTYSDNALDEYIGAIEAASRVYTTDATIDMIIYEEMQPYFAGDKALDEVVDIMNSRIDLVRNERG